MKTPLPILLFLFLLTGAGVNFSEAQISSCSTTVNGPNKICSGGCATLSAVYTSMTICGNITYQWASGGQTTSSIVVCPSATTTYSVTACCTGPNPCCHTAAFTLPVAPTPTVTIMGVDTICAGQGTSLCASTGMVNGATYLWMPGGQTTACIYVSPSATTTYTVSVTDATGCTGSSTHTINVINCSASACTASINGQNQICSGACTTLNAGFSSTLACTGLTYQWSPGGQTTASITVCPSAAASYSVIVCCTGTSSCCDTASFTVNVNPLPVVNITGPATLCNGQSTTLCTNAMGTSYLWMPGFQTSPCAWVMPTVTTTYTITVTDANGCSNTATHTLTVLQCPTGTGENTFANQATIFPNPFSEYSIVRINDARLIPCELKIYNLLGIEVKTIRIESSETKIPRENLPAGIYYYRLEQKGRVNGNGKLVIE